MKKQHLLLNFMALLLSLMSVQDIMAAKETRQDALYIFRNDGQFDFFFYGDIDRIAYSKIDTLGVEQPDYVVQEVWALDTVFRIPLTAIDSVAFVTPETKVWPDVFCPDERIGDYIIDGDSVWWIRLAHNTPPELLPTKGGKLLIDEGISPFIPYGFGGRVGAVVHEDSGWLIATLPTDITDIYQQLVAKGAAATPGAQRRAPNRDFDGTYYTDVPITTLNIPEMDNEFSLSKGVISTPDGSPISISADLTGTIHPKFSGDMEYRACLFVSPFLQMPKLTFSGKILLHYNSEVEFELAGDLNSRIELGISKKVDKIDRLLLDFGAGLYIEGSIGGYNVKTTVKQESQFAIFSKLNCERFTSLADLKPDNAIPSFEPRYTPIHNSMTWESNLPWENDSIIHLPKVSIGGGVFAKAKTELAIPLSKARKMMPDWLAHYMYQYALGALLDSAKISFEVGLDIGGKVSMKAPWHRFFDEVPLFEQNGGLYRELSDDSEFEGEIHDKFTAQLNLPLWKPGVSPGVTVPSKVLGLVPNIWSINARIDPNQRPIKPYLYSFSAPITRDLILPVTVGFLVLDIDNDIEAKYCGTPWSGEIDFENDPQHNFFNNGTYFRTMSIDPAKGETKTYWAYPILRLINGHEVLVDKFYQFEVDSAHFEIPQRTVYVGPEGGMVQGEYSGEMFVEVIPNMENVQLSTNDNWIDHLYWYGEDNKLGFHWKDLPELPEGERQRRGTIYLTGLSKFDEVLAEDSITVIQAPVYVIVEPNKMEFPINGGTQTATIVETSLSNISAKISTSSYTDDIHVSLDGNTITVTADENTGEDSRSTWVLIEGTGPDGLPASSYAIDITQEGLGGDDPGTFEPTTKRMLWDTNISYDVATRIVTQDTTFYATMSSGGSFYHDEHDNDDDWAYYIYKEDITDSGTSLHVKLYSKETPMQNGIPTGSYVVETLSFDILNYNNIAVGGRQISNIRHERNGYIDNELYESWEIEIANLPITEYYDSEIEGYHQQSISAGGTAYGGVNIISGKVTYYVPDDDGEIHVLNYPFSVDHPDNTVEFEVDFFGDFGEYYYWNEEYGEYVPEGFDPGEWPDDPDWDKGKIQEKVKAMMDLRQQKKEEKAQKRRVDRP